MMTISRWLHLKKMVQLVSSNLQPRENSAGWWKFSAQPRRREDSCHHAYTKSSPRLWSCSVSSSIRGGLQWIHSAAAEFVQQLYIGINVSMIIDICVGQICMQNIFHSCMGCLMQNLPGMCWTDCFNRSCFENMLLYAYAQIPITYPIQTSKQNSFAVFSSFKAVERKYIIKQNV